MKTHINWNIFFVLLAAFAFGLVAITPYSLALQQNALANIQLPIPLAVLIPIQLLSQTLLFGIFIALGLFFAGRTGLGLPILEARLRGESVANKIRAVLPISIALGIGASLLIIGLEVVVFQPAMIQQLGDKANALNLETSQSAAWKGFLASFYGGINEEILLRLIVMSFLAWLGKFISRTADGKPTNAVLWSANILAAVLFGLGHLPATALLVPLTPLIILRAIVLNGVVGIVCGWLYQTRGLEAAMMSHFSADIVLHVLLAL
ncbi:MAG TPA: CPBP family intramembrane glutamic endopeptidase [Anaerolineales bacterium]|nr:CPBP family intramembrane glutamic endopeptidase [Anaerolineales bacterium]